MSTSPIRVFIVEDQPAILKAQVKILSNAKELEIIGSAMSGEQALEAIPADADVILCDLGLPGIDGIEVTKRVKERQPNTEVLIFTIFEEENVAACRGGLPAQRRRAGDHHQRHPRRPLGRLGDPADAGAPSDGTLQGDTGASGTPTRALSRLSAR